MNRDKEIWNAIFKLRLGNYSDDALLGKDEYSGDDIQDAFYKGAKWADEHSKSPWISVEEDLPYNHEELLDGNITRQVFVRTKNGGYDISFMFNFIRWEFVIGLENVTHWMPIPKLPEE